MALVFGRRETALFPCRSNGPELPLILALILCRMSLLGVKMTAALSFAEECSIVLGRALVLLSRFGDPDTPVLLRPAKQEA